LRAIGLVSGGLDSTLATKMIKDHGIDVDAVNFYTGFCVAEHRRKIGRDDGRTDGRNEALRAGADIGVKIEIIDISDEYLRIVAHPKYGYGSAINPCIDCRIMMLKKARERMEATRAGFVFTGEVLGQRPMSQHKNQLRLIEKESGLEGLLLRPLSAQLLPPTTPEKEGWVERERLYAIKGRGRKEQMRLARAYGITDYPQPAGGCCYLTDRSYAVKLRDLFEHKGRDSVTRDDVILLKVGRHFRVSPEAKVIVGRDEQENGFLSGYFDGRWVFKVLGFEGPTAVLEGEATPEDRLTAAAITARYSDAEGEEPVQVEFSRGADRGVLAVKPVVEDIERLRI
jgi:tRNA-specific 2-thiouridylase